MGNYYLTVGNASSGNKKVRRVKEERQEVPGKYCRGFSHSVKTLNN